ncbi:MAG: hypothetical protein RIC55_15030 [Pirellulaceae bacterium]
MSIAFGSSHAAVAAEYRNPFATRHIRPGAVEFVFPSEESADSLVRRLEAAAWRGAIVGPHGSGKSTLLETLLPRIERRGRCVVRRTLRAGQRSLGVPAAERRAWGAATLLVVDGYEQLSWRSRLGLLWSCRRTGCGLLATSHRPVGLTTIFRTTVTECLARRVVERIAPQDDVLRQVDLCDLLDRRGGDLREVLFDLYDVYESRRS